MAPVSTYQLRPVYVDSEVRRSYTTEINIDPTTGGRLPYTVAIVPRFTGYTPNYTPALVRSLSSSNRPAICLDIKPHVVRAMCFGNTCKINVFYGPSCCPMDYIAVPPSWSANEN